MPRVREGILPGRRAVQDVEVRSRAGAIMRAVSAMPRVSGVILAGGKSRRMGGSPKALLPFGGRPLIQHIAETLRSVFSDCLVVTNTPDLYRFLGLPMTGDVFPDGGSLGGIYSGLRAAQGEAALCVACDMPFLSAPLLADLAGRAGEADVVIPDAGGELQTLHAVYGKACLPAMERRLRAGQLKVIGFFDDVRVLRIPAGAVERFADPELAFMNLNTPEDLARARTLWGHQPVRAARGPSPPAPEGGGAAA
jgi:molybdopterin-guanine dinucleotide biosynthesis protein A